MSQWRGDDVGRASTGRPGADRAGSTMGGAGDAPRPRGGGAPKGPVLLLVGILVGALIALGFYLVVGNNNDEGAPDVAAVSTAPETGAPSSEGVGDGTEPASPPATAGDDADAATDSPSPAPPQPEPTNEPDIMRGEENLIAPAAGTYSGVLFQRGTEQSDQSVEVAMGFSSTGSYIDYPALGCSGTLMPTGNQDGARVYRETITSGQCDPTGTWFVTRGSDNTISAEYRPSEGDHVVEGQLSR